MSEKGASTPARRPVGAVHSGRRAALARPQQQAPHRRGFGMLALACVTVGVTGTTWQQASVPQAAAAAVASAQVHAVVAAVQAVVTAPVQGAHAASAMEIKAPAAQAAEAAAVTSPAALFAVLAQAEPSEKYYDKLRAEMRWTPVRVGDRKLATPDGRSRLLLAQSAAELAELDEVGLDFRDVYGVINAETTWVPRTGMGKNGVASHGLAQFEPGTAKAVGLSNPNDPVEAVHAAAVLLKEAATWSSRRIAALNLTPEMHAVKLREGVSIYYNLSSKARRQWSGANTQNLPVETLRHIRNVRMGAEQAELLQERIAAAPAAAAGLVRVDFTPPPAPEAAPVRGRQAAPARTAEPAPVARARAAAPAPASRPVVVADRTGRKTWVLPQGTIAWSNG